MGGKASANGRKMQVSHSVAGVSLMLQKDEGGGDSRNKPGPERQQAGCGKGTLVGSVCVAPPRHATQGFRYSEVGMVWCSGEVLPPYVSRGIMNLHE